MMPVREGGGGGAEDEDARKRARLERDQGGGGSSSSSSVVDLFSPHLDAFAALFGNHGDGAGVNALPVQPCDSMYKARYLLPPTDEDFLAVRERAAHSILQQQSSAALPTANAAPPKLLQQSPPPQPHPQQQYQSPLAQIAAQFHTGPMSVLHRNMRKPIRVGLVRRPGEAAELSWCRGTLVAFDRHMNIILANASYEYRVKHTAIVSKRRKSLHARVEKFLMDFANLKDDAGQEVQEQQEQEREREQEEEEEEEEEEVKRAAVTAAGVDGHVRRRRRNSSLTRMGKDNSNNDDDGDGGNKTKASQASQAATALIQTFASTSELELWRHVYHTYDIHSKILPFAQRTSEIEALLLRRTGYEKELIQQLEAKRAGRAPPTPVESAEWVCLPSKKHPGRFFYRNQRRNISAWESPPGVRFNQVVFSVPQLETHKQMLIRGDAVVVVVAAAAAVASTSSSSSSSSSSTAAFPFASSSTNANANANANASSTST